MQNAEIPTNIADQIDAKAFTILDRARYGYGSDLTKDEATFTVEGYEVTVEIQPDADFDGERYIDETAYLIRVTKDGVTIDGVMDMTEEEAVFEAA